MKRVAKTEIWLVILLLICIMVVVAIAVYMNVIKASTEGISDNASEQINTSLPSQECIMHCVQNPEGSCLDGTACSDVLFDEKFKP